MQSYLQNKIWLAMADACFDNTKMSILERFEWAKAHGCFSIEAGQAGIHNPHEYQAAMQKTGLFVHGVNVWHPGDEYFSKAIEAAKLLGAQYITHQVPKQDNLKTGLAFLQKHQQVCQQNGLDYLIETHRWTASEKLSDLAYYLENMPELSVLSDLSHYIPLLHQPTEFNFIHKRSKAMHIRVATENNVQVEIGESMNHEGCELFSRIWTDLLKSGFTGPVVGEIIPHYVTYPAYDSVKDNANGLNLFRKTLIQAGYQDKLLKCIPSAKYSLA